MKELKLNAQDAIRIEAIKRRIEHLVHFTPFSNAESILENGFASRKILDDYNLDYTPTDNMRLDCFPDAISLSVGDVNVSMFTAKKKHHSDWVIFALNPSILWNQPCKFCWTNAASKAVKSHKGWLAGPYGFDRMFWPAQVSGSDTRCQRDVYNLRDSDPTDNAAEVQVLHQIDSELILAAVVRTDYHKTTLEASMVKHNLVRPVYVDASPFI